jgi:hypothetical protein
MASLMFDYVSGWSAVTSSPPPSSSIRPQAGKYYKTRAGRKAFVSGRNAFSSAPDTRLVGSLESGEVLTWSESGQYCCGMNHGRDLIAEWRDPIVKTVDVYLYENFSGEPHVALNRPESFGGKTLARAKVTLTEGVGA